MPPLEIQYKDFSVWQNRMFEEGGISRQEAYWKEIFAHAEDIPTVALPTDFPRPGVFTFAGDYYDFTLEEELSESFRRLNRSLDATLTMNILAAFNVLLQAYTGQDDIVVGMGIMGRTHADLHDLIGLFVNSLAVRNHPVPEKNVSLVP